MTPEGRGGGAVLWWFALNHIKGAGAATMLRLARVFGSPEAAVHASPDELVARGELSPEQAKQVVALAASLDEFEGRLGEYARRDVALLPTDDPCYPRQLLDLRSPPPLLYVRGTLLPEDRRAIAVVGTRTPTREGARLAAHLARSLAARGFTLVSGLARGIDTAAHRGALAAEQGRTIAVLGSGLLRIYPPENLRLAAKIAARGALLAEVPPETEVNRRWLLARDRLQAALSRAVIVVQAHRECGSLVTARDAVQCGRLLLGVPWDQPPFADGWQALHALGARPLTPETDLDALAAELDLPRPSPAQPPLL